MKRYTYWACYYDIRYDAYVVICREFTVRTQSLYIAAAGIGVSRFNEAKDKKELLETTIQEVMHMLICKEFA